MSLGRQKSHGEIIREIIMNTIIDKVANLPEVMDTIVKDNDESFSKTMKILLVDNDDYGDSPMYIDINIR